MNIHWVWMTLFSWMISMSVHANERLDIEKKISHVQHSIQTLQEDSTKQTAAIGHALTALKETEEAYGTLNKEVRALQANIQEKKHAIIDIEHTKKQLSAEQANIEAAIGQLIRYHLIHGEEGLLHILLNQTNTQAISQLTHFYPLITKAHQQHMASLQSRLEELGTIQASLRQSQAELMSLESQLNKERSHLEAQKNKRIQAIDTLHTALDQTQARLEHHLSEQVALESILMRLHNEAAATAAQAFAAQKGKLPRPLQMPAAREPHFINPQASFFKTPANTAIQAIHTGQVIFADWLKGFGLLIVLDHGEGFLSLYGHNRSLNVNKGDWVNPEDIIALSGDSGGLKESGLYFELRKDGHPLPADQWLNQ